MILSKTGQRRVGLLLFAVGGGLTAWSWYSAPDQGHFYRKAAAIFPAIAVAGVGMLLLPVDLERLRANVVPGAGQKRVNPFYAGVVLLGLLVPLASVLYARSLGRDSFKPHGLFMIGLFAAGLSLLAVGLTRRRDYAHLNRYWALAIAIGFPLSLAFLFLLSFVDNFRL